MTSEVVLERKYTVFSNGEWHTGKSREELEVFDPSNGSTIALLRPGNSEDVARASRAALDAFASWKYKPALMRTQFLRGFARGLESRREYLIRIQMHNNGKPRAEAEIDIGDAIATFDYYADFAEDLDSEQDARIDHKGGTHVGLARHEPIGPVGMIVPWSFPLVTSARKIAPALAAGCTAVLKTSEVTPLVELIYGDIADEIDLPPGVLNIVTGATDVGIALTRAPELRKITFTGSDKVGAKVMRAVSNRCLPLTLELGGKSTIIVTEDSNIERAVKCIHGGIFFNAGQMCSATARLVVAKSIEKDLIEALVENTRMMRVGSPFNKRTEMGPITTKDQFGKVLKKLAAALADGLDCLTGGGKTDHEAGNFVAPTIFRNVPHDNRIWQEEIFGPVLATTTVGSDDEAVAVANATPFCLVGSIVCGDWARGKAIADRIEAGRIWINTPQNVCPDSNSECFKSSGISREPGFGGLSPYQCIKHVLKPA